MPGRAPDAARPTGRSRLARTAGPVLAGVALVAAGCSGGVTAGQVGTAEQMGAVTVTLDKVIEPAPLSPTAPVQTGPGRALVAVVLTFKNTSSSAADISKTYQTSRLTESSGRIRYPNPSKFRPTDCQVFESFGQLLAQQSITGCEVFQLSTSVTPTHFAITGPPEVTWTIAAASIEAPQASASVPGSPTTAATTAKGTTGSTGNTGSAGNSGNTGNTGSGKSATKGTGSSSGTSTTTTTTSASGLRILDTVLPPVTQGLGYTYKLSATGAVAPYKWKLNGGSLPRGIKLSANGVLHGRTRAGVSPGVFVFSVRVRDSGHHRSQATATQSLSMQLQ